MTLLITVFAAAIATIFWYNTKSDRKLGTLALMYWLLCLENIAKKGKSQSPMFHILVFWVQSYEKEVKSEK